MERPPRRRSRGRGILIALALTIAAVVVLAGVWYYYLGPGGTSTPEEVFLGMIDALNSADAEALISLTTTTFANEAERESAIDDWVDMLHLMDNLTFAVASLTVIDREMMEPDVMEELDRTVQWTESNYQVEVEDSCAVMFVLTINLGYDSETEEGAVPLVMVNSDWYIALLPFPTGEVIIEPAP